MIKHLRIVKACVRFTVNNLCDAKDIFSFKIDYQQNLRDKVILGLLFTGGFSIESALPADAAVFSGSSLNIDSNLVPKKFVYIVATFWGL